jgi:hypothetical protein
MADVQVIGLKSEADDIIEFKEDPTAEGFRTLRIDQRITLKPIEYARPGKEDTTANPERGERMQLFIITGKATQAEKDALEDASRTWYKLGSGKYQGRVRFKWGDNKGDGSVAGSYYDCVFRKTDFTEEAAKAKYDFMIELLKSEFRG